VTLPQELQTYLPAADFPLPAVLAVVLTLALVPAVLTDFLAVDFLTVFFFAAAFFFAVVFFTMEQPPSEL